MNCCPRPKAEGNSSSGHPQLRGVIVMIITQPTIYRVIAYFSLYHELVSDRSIVLDITWDYTMAWYPAKKISEL